MASSGKFGLGFDPLTDAEGPRSGTDGSLKKPGAMQAAIRETATAKRERGEKQAAIRAENDALAHEYADLQRRGLVPQMIDCSAILTTALIRDRAVSVDLELDELKASIADVGLSNPIRVIRAGDAFQLVQGFRRLSAFQSLAEDTGDSRWHSIPAVVVPDGETLDELYRAMVDENLVRKDVSYPEMGQLAVSYARDRGVTIKVALARLYASVSKQKRSNIGKLAAVAEHLGDYLQHFPELSRDFGIQIADALKNPILIEQVISALRAEPDRDSSRERAILTATIKPPKAELAAPTVIDGITVRRKKGRVELSDLPDVDDAKLVAATRAFIDTLRR